jgi:ubiquinone biosynthesis protein UbiJ
LPGNEPNPHLHDLQFIAPVDANAGVFQFLARLEHLLQTGRQRNRQVLHRNLGDIVHQQTRRALKITIRIPQDM